MVGLGSEVWLFLVYQILRALTFKHYHVIYLPYRFLKSVKEMWLWYDFTSSRSERSKIFRCSFVKKDDRFLDISFTRPLSLCYVEIMIYWYLLKAPEMFPSENERTCATHSR